MFPESIENPRRHHPVRCTNAPPESGFTLIETVIAMAVAAAGLLAMASVITECTVLQQAVREETVAHEKVRDAVEQLRGHSPASVLSTFRINAPAWGGAAGIPLDRVTDETSHPGLGLDFEVTVKAPVVNPSSSTAILNGQFAWVRNQMNSTSLTVAQKAAFLQRCCPLKILNKRKSALGERSTSLTTFVSKIR